MHRYARTILIVGGLIFCAAAVDAQIDARLLRQPDVSATQITFVYGGDIWIVAKEGGVAQRLSTPAGEESFPRFSPDGTLIGFTGNYDGNEDIFVIPVGGGVPTRVTHHPDQDRMLGWYPDGESILFATLMTSEKQRYRKLFRVPVTGGLPKVLPVPYGEFGAISDDGSTLAYMPLSRDFRTWKRYRGGTAPEIWLFGLNDLQAKNVTQSDANDSQPMWHGSTLYFMSDRDGNLRANIWALDVTTGEERQVTFFEEFDVHFPAIGPHDMVFENGGRLYVMDLATETSRVVEIKVITDRRLAAAARGQGGEPGRERRHLALGQTGCPRSSRRDLHPARRARGGAQSRPGPPGSPSATRSGRRTARPSPISRTARASTNSRCGPPTVPARKRS